MGRLTIAAVAGAALAFGAASSAQAQDAAESAAILGATSGQKEGARSLGEAISGAMGQVGEEIRNSRSRPAGTPAEPFRRNSSGATTAWFPMSGSVEADALAHAEVATYRLENGVRMRVSGIFHPSDTTVCEAFCPAAS